MIRRHLKKIVLDRLKTYPAVAIFGPRQVGKTTLAKEISPLYFDLEQESERLRLDIQWEEALSRGKPIVLDEAQNHPEIFPRIRGVVDADRRRKGSFLILGSVSPALMKRVAESLTGRVALCELAPFTVTELPRRRADDLWLKGGYPDGGILGKEGYPLWQRNYLDLLAMRDLPSWGLPARPATTLRLFRMLAAVHGAPWNASQIGASLGLSYHTVNSYLDYLEGAYLIRRLPSYHANVGKRLTKSPKVYWRDSGLLHSLLNVVDSDDLFAQPWVGASWEGWVIEQVMGVLNLSGQVIDGPWFLRSKERREIDLMFILKRRMHAIEIKLSSNPRQEEFDQLRRTADLVGADVRALISRTSRPVTGRDEFSTTLRGFLEYLAGEVAGGASR